MSEGKVSKAPAESDEALTLDVADEANPEPEPQPAGDLGVLNRERVNSIKDDSFGVGGSDRAQWDSSWGRGQAKDQPENHPGYIHYQSRDGS